MASSRGTGVNKVPILAIVGVYSGVYEIDIIFDPLQAGGGPAKFVDSCLDVRFHLCVVFCHKTGISLLLFLLLVQQELQ
jgi:hypothetical protein